MAIIVNFYQSQCYDVNYGTLLSTPSIKVTITLWGTDYNVTTGSTSSAGSVTLPSQPGGISLNVNNTSFNPPSIAGYKYSYFRFVSGDNETTTFTVSEGTNNVRLKLYYVPESSSTNVTFSAQVILNNFYGTTSTNTQWISPSLTTQAPSTYPNAQVSFTFPTASEFQGVPPSAIYTKLGVDFKGWGGEVATENNLYSYGAKTTLTAYQSGVIYTFYSFFKCYSQVTFESEGQLYSSTKYESSIFYKSAPQSIRINLIKPSSTPNGYKFNGWKDSNGNTYKATETIAIVSSSSITFTAQWEKVVTFQMTFYTSISLDGGAGTITEPNLSPSKLVLTPEQYDNYNTFDIFIPNPIGTPTKTGYFFNGWKCEGKSLPATMSVVKPVWLKDEDYVGFKTFNIIAQWAPRKWTATLNYASTETGPMGIQNLPAQQSQSYTYNEVLPENASFNSSNESVTFSFTVSSQKPTSTNNYHFVKWVDSNGNAITNPILITVNKNSSSDSSTASKTLYANWRQGAIAWIFNGSEWVQATPWIFNGSEWVQAIPHIYIDSTNGWR